MEFFKLSFLFLLISATRLFGQTAPLDTAFLIDGSYITGEILNPGSENSIQIKNNEGAIIYIKNQRIEKLVIDPNRPISRPETQYKNTTPINYSKKAADSNINYRNRIFAINVF